MRYNKIQIIFALLIVLGIIYSVNIFLTKNISDAFIDKPAKISFLILEPPKDVCENCFDANSIIQMVNNAHSIKYKTNNISYNDALSQKYVEMYNIKNLPAVIVFGDIENEKVIPAWKALSGQKIENNIIIENLLPYYDIESRNVKGVISAILIKDESCENCFDEIEYINAVKRFNIFIGSTVIYDIESLEGSAFVNKYTIDKVPALILSPDTLEYDSFVSLWGEVGTIEEDGFFIFREVQKLNPQYKEI